MDSSRNLSVLKQVIHWNNGSLSLSLSRGCPGLNVTYHALITLQHHSVKMTLGSHDTHKLTTR